MFEEHLICFYLFNMNISDVTKILDITALRYMRVQISAEKYMKSGFDNAHISEGGNIQYFCYIRYIHLSIN